MGYSDVVNNSTTIHSQVRAGVKAPDVPLAIGVDTEYTRTDCSSKHVVGLKVKNRTISFRVDFDDLPKSFVTEVEEAKEKMRQMDKSRFESDPSPQASVDGATAVDGSQPKPEDIPFESRLCKWLLDCLEHRGVKTKGKTLYQLLFTKTEGKGGPSPIIDSEQKTRKTSHTLCNSSESPTTLVPSNWAVSISASSLKRSTKRRFPQAETLRSILSSTERSRRLRNSHS